MFQLIAHCAKNQEERLLTATENASYESNYPCDTKENTPPVKEHAIVLVTGFVRAPGIQ